MSDIFLCRRLSNENTLILIDDTNFSRLNSLLNILVVSRILIEVNFNDIGLKPTKYHRVYKYIY